MLELKVFDGERNVRLQFEHSLLSLSKWESKYKVPFLDNPNKLHTELIDYYQDMLMTPDVDSSIVFRLSPEQLDEISKYINDPMTANAPPPLEKKGGGMIEVLTSDLIYFYLVQLRIPFEPTNTWHINRVMMLIQIASFKQQPPKKQNPAEAWARFKEINAQRRAKYGSTG